MITPGLEDALFKFLDQRMFEHLPIFDRLFGLTSIVTPTIESGRLRAKMEENSQGKYSPASFRITMIGWTAPGASIRACRGISHVYQKTVWYVNINI